MNKSTKILAVRTHYKSSDGKERLSAVDWWRVENPLKHISKKYPNIEVDFVNQVVDENGDIDTQWMDVGANYDIIYTSYIDSPKGYSYIKAIADMYGIKHIMDIDDNIFSIDHNNPAYLRYYPGSPFLENASIIVGDVDYLVCSTEQLANECIYRTGRTKPTFVMENYIDDKFFDTNKREFNDSEEIHIGYMGSSTHYSDLMNTGVLWAIRRIFSEKDNVHLHIVGSMYEEVEKMFIGYEDRLHQVGGSRDFSTYARDIWTKFPFDIAIAPLIDSPFNSCKSSIKYYEYALANIAGVYSFTDSYMDKVVEGETGLFAETEQEWYYKLMWLINDPELKVTIRNKARKDVLDNYTIDKNVDKLYEILQEI